MKSKGALLTPELCSFAFALYKSEDRSHELLSRAANSPAAVVTASKPRDKFSLVQNIQADKFSDIIAEVVKTYPLDDRQELYVTDYTSNNELFNYLQSADEGDREGREGDDFGYIPKSQKNWPGPHGKHTLLVTLWQPHSNYARENVKERDFVQLRNVRIKYGREVARLEGTLYCDQAYPDRLYISKLKPDGVDTDERLKDLVRRRRDYWKSHGNERKGDLGTVDEQKRKAGPDRDQGKAKNKRRKKQQQQQQEQEQEDMQGQFKNKETNKHGMPLTCPPSK